MDIKEEHEDPPAEAQEEIQNDKTQRREAIKGKLLRCKEWILSQNDLKAEDLKTENGHAPVQAIKLESNNEYDDVTCSKLRRRYRKKNISKQVIRVACEWIGCQYSSENYAEFQIHVKKHISEVYLKTYEDGETLYACLWEICGFETQNDKEIIRHINFHAYHSRLKAISINVRERYNLEKCTRDSSQRNQLPELLSDNVCQWFACNQTFSSVQEFIDHVYCHIIGVVVGADGKLLCGWLGCRQRFPNFNKIKMHARRHTGERIVACLHCGGMFASNAVYEDHLKRQAGVVSKLSCDTCGKLFSTERLLKNHARRHINSQKCQFCDMTCGSPSALIKHIRYRHLDYRPFQCQYCSYRAVSNNDMRVHLLRHEGIVQIRKPKSTEKKIRVYACHSCEKCYGVAGHLSKHLIHVHEYVQLPGHRFRYGLSEDGVYRFQKNKLDDHEMSEPNDKNQPSQATKNADEKGQDFKLIQCTPGSTEKVASFVLLPSSLEDKASSEAVIAMQKNADVLNEEYSYVPSKKRAAKNKTRSKKLTTKSKRKRMRSKPQDPAHSKVSNDTFGSSTQSDINEFSCMKRFKPSPKVEGKSIEISIAEIDEEGNVIKTEVIESQELIV